MTSGHEERALATPGSVPGPVKVTAAVEAEREAASTPVPPKPQGFGPGTRYPSKSFSFDSSQPISPTIPIPPDRRSSNTAPLTTYPTFRDKPSFKKLLDMSCRSGICRLSLAVDWAIQEFCRTELPDYEQLESDLPLVLTMTKVTPKSIASGATQAASCEDYTNMVWGARGGRILRAILAGVKAGSCDYVEGTLSLVMIRLKPSEAVVSLSGPLPDVADVLEQLAWMASTFRPSSSESPICESSVQLSIDSINGHRLSVQELRPYLRPPRSAPCWTLAIPATIIACEFPIRERKAGKGVEISFELMASLLRVSTISEIQGHQALVGASNVLVPSGLLDDGDDAVQWHCVSIKKLVTSDLDDILKGSTPVDKPVAELAQLRCFLGYFERATVHLGTEEILQQVVRETNLANSQQRLEFAREVTFSTGFSIPGIINGTVGGKVLLHKSLQVALNDEKEYHDLLADSKLQSVVLYDVNNRIGWLVSELSIILHLVLMFLNLPETKPRYQGKIPDLRYVPGARDGGQAAMDFVYRHGDLPLWKKASSTEYKLFHDVVDDFLRSVRALGNASLLQQKPNRSLQMAELRGWDFMDILRKRSLVNERKLPSRDVPSWWRLCNEGDVYTIFETGLGQVIRPTSVVPPGWLSVPEGACLLVASMPCIWQLHESANAGVEQNRGYHITQNLLWDSHCERAKGCDRSCEQFIQNLRPITMFEKASTPAIAVNRCDAVIFGDHQRFHEVVRQLGLGTSRLDRILRIPVPTPVQRRDGLLRQDVLDETRRNTGNAAPPLTFSLAQ